MAELELEVENARDEERVHARHSQPIEEASHDLGDIRGWSPGMDEGVPVEHAHVTGAEAPGVGDEATHHHAVNAQQIFH